MQIVQWLLGILLILSALGVILLKKPVHASLSFLFMLLTLSAYYLQLSAQFIAVMQVLVYAGAILIIFMFVVILFQDAHEKIQFIKPQSYLPFLILSALVFLFTLLFFGVKFLGLQESPATAPEGFGMVQTLGRALYIDYFFPFEAVILLFLISVVGALYMGKKGA